MLDRTKTIELNGRTFAFKYPTAKQNSGIHTEVLRRMNGVISLSADYDAIFTRIYYDICLERLITEAPPNWWKTLPIPNADPKAEPIRFISIDDFYEDDQEYKEVREAMITFLESFRGHEKSPESVPVAGGEGKVGGGESVPAPAPVQEPERDFGSGDPGA